MSDTGEVGRDTVLAVLKASGVDVSLCEEDPNGEWMTLAKGDRTEVQKFCSRISRKMLHYLHHHYDIPIHHFYHPDMISTDKPGNEERPSSRVQ